MVERNFSKVVTRVRFSSPAHIIEASILKASKNPKIPIAKNASPPPISTTGCLTIPTVFFGNKNNPIVSSICPSITPRVKPNTFTYSKRGIYPAKSLIPKINGIVKEKTIRFIKLSFFVPVRFKSGTRNLSTGLNWLFTKSSWFCKRFTGILIFIKLFFCFRKISKFSSASFNKITEEINTPAVIRAGISLNKVQTISIKKVPNALPIEVPNAIAILFLHPGFVCIKFPIKIAKSIAVLR